MEKELARTEIREESAVHGFVTDRGDVANDDEALTRSSERNIDPPRVLGEPEAGPSTHQAENHEVTLGPLKSVSRCNRDAFCGFPRESLSKKLPDQEDLTLVERADANLCGRRPTGEEAIDDIIGGLRFSSVTVRSPTAWRFLVTRYGPKEQRLCCSGSRELDVALSILCGDAVEKLALIELL
jgi:hypothetical protein